MRQSVRARSVEPVALNAWDRLNAGSRVERAGLHLKSDARLGSPTPVTVN